MSSVFSDLQKSFGADKIWRASEAPEMEVVSTGVAGLDYVTGVGGIPRGTIVEIFGRESVGKTSLSYYIMKQHQMKLSSPDRGIAFVNLEGNFSAGWAKQIAGIQLENLIVATPLPGTEAVEITAKMVNSGGIDLIVFDSIGAMVGDKEIQPGEKKQAGGQSALVTHMIDQVLVPAYANRCTVVFLNQVRDVFDSMYKMEESPGGHAAKHAAAMRFHLKPGRDKLEGTVDGEKVQVMGRVTCKVKKNKVGAPNRQAAWNFWNFPSPDGIVGIDTTQDIIDLAMRTNIIKRAGAWYQHDEFPDGKINGGKGVTEFLRENQDALEQIRKEVVTHGIVSNSQQDSSVREVLTDAAL